VQCNGQILPISQNTALFSLLGTTFGGNGISTFALPNLQGRFGLSVGTGFPLGEMGGEANHTLVAAESPAHAHPVLASGAVGTSGTPVNNFPAMAADGASLFGPPTTNTFLGTGSEPAGGGQPHSNLQPYLAICFCIALQGIFPSRN
jgi:microcystin-dependent protein